MSALFKKLFKNDNTAPRCSAVVLAAGSSSRMGTDKIMLNLGNCPVILHSLKVFEASPLIKEIIIVTRKEKASELKRLCEEYSITKVSGVVEGGETRLESSFNGVTAASPDSEIIAIHDAARPFITEELLESLIAAAHKFHSAIPAIPAKDTVIIANNGFVDRTTDRSSTYLVQTPQVFDADIIKGALSSAIKNNLPVTDDSSAVEALGIHTYIVEGSSENIKLTDKNDFRLARVLFDIRGEAD